MKGELEADFRARYTLVDKTDPKAIAAAQQAGISINDDGELVGEADGTNFGVGTAPTSARPAHSSVVASKRREQRRGRGGKDRNRFEDIVIPEGLPPTKSTMKLPKMKGWWSFTPFF